MISKRIYGRELCKTSERWKLVFYFSFSRKHSPLKVPWNHKFTHHQAAVKLFGCQTCRTVNTCFSRIERWPCGAEGTRASLQHVLGASNAELRSSQGHADPVTCWLRLRCGHSFQRHRTLIKNGSQCQICDSNLWKAMILGY